MAYKNFSNLNQALAQAKMGDATTVIERFIQESRDLIAIPRDLPSSWARAYSGVMVLKYDSSGNPTDVTETTSPNATDAPNSLISNVKQRFNQLKQDYDNDKAFLNDQAFIAPNSQSLSSSLATVQSGGVFNLIKLTIPNAGDRWFYLDGDTGHYVLTPINPGNSNNTAYCVSSSLYIPGNDQMLGFCTSFYGDANHQPQIIFTRILLDCTNPRACTIQQMAYGDIQCRISTVNADANFMFDVPEPTPTVLQNVATYNNFDVKLIASSGDISGFIGLSDSSIDDLNSAINSL